MAVGWFTAKDDSPKVQLALSTDSGEHFSAPIRVSGPDTIGRIDTAILANGQVAVRAGWTRQLKQLSLPFHVSARADH